MKRLQAITAIACATAISFTGMPFAVGHINEVQAAEIAAAAEDAENVTSDATADEQTSDSEQAEVVSVETEKVLSDNAEIQKDDAVTDPAVSKEATDDAVLEENIEATDTALSEEDMAGACEIEIITVDTYDEVLEYTPADLDSASSYVVDLNSGDAKGSNAETITVEEAFGIEEAASASEITEAIDDSDLYVLDEEQSDDDSAVVYSPFARHRIIVYTDEEIADTFGATAGTYLTDDGGYRLCYADDEATKAAYDALTEAYGEEAVMLDLAMGLSTTAAGTQPKGWGSSYMHLDGISQSVAKNKTGKAISVAILDSGIKKDHVVFSGKTISSNAKSVIGGSITDENGHGTAVAGIIAESTSDNVQLMPIKIADGNGESSLDYMLQGMDYAVESGASVVNLSMNACFKDSNLTDAQIKEDIAVLESSFSKYEQAGMVICVSAGNDARDIRSSYNYPAMSSHVLCVGAINSSGQKTSFSSYGSDLDFAAPGESVDCAWIGSTTSWKTLSGTSMASPYLTAACAMIKSTNPNATLSSVEKTLAGISKDLGSSGKDIQYGYGVPIFKETAVYSSTQSGNASGKTTLIDGINLPADWDPNDPGSYKAYDQMYGNVSEELHYANGMGAALLKASYIVTKTKWAIYGESTSAEFQHDSKNTTGSDIIPVIDVSYHNGDIDWTKVKDAGVQGVMIRCGFRGRADGSLNTDVKFYENIKTAKATGLKVGVYFFSQAVSTAEGIGEADYAMDLIKNSGVKLDLPLAIDIEYYSSGSNRLKNAKLSKQAQTDVAAAFCSRVKSSGYTPMIYASSVFLVENLNGVSLAEQGYKIWMARYRYAAYSDSSIFYNEPVMMWQCTSQAAVSGIDTAVDLNYWYKTGGYNGWKQDAGGWYWLNEDGTIAKNKWLKYNSAWYYLKADGHMATNQWQKDNSGWCWVGSDGKMAFAKWIQVSGEWYYINSSGHRIQNGWAKDSKGWCWLGADGKIVKSKWIKTGGEWYYLKSNGYMAANEWAKDSAGWMWMASGGEITKSKWVKWNGYWYYLKSNGYMAANEYAKDSKKTYWMNSSGRISN